MPFLGHRRRLPICKPSSFLLGTRHVDLFLLDRFIELFQPYKIVTGTATAINKMSRCG